MHWRELSRGTGTETGVWRGQAAAAPRQGSWCACAAALPVDGSAAQPFVEVAIALTRAGLGGGWPGRMMVHWLGWLVAEALGGALKRLVLYWEVEEMLH